MPVNLIVQHSGLVGHSGCYSGAQQVAMAQEWVAVGLVFGSGCLGDDALPPGNPSGVGMILAVNLVHLGQLVG